MARGLPKTPKQFLTFGLNYKEIDVILEKYLLISQNLCIFPQVTQILIGLIYLYFGIIVSSKINDSEFTEYFFSSFKAGYPFWGALFVSIRLQLSEIILHVAFLLLRSDLTIVYSNKC